MTPSEHAAQVRMVNASMCRDEDRHKAHNVYRISAYRPCGRCGEPRAYNACPRCDRPAAA